MITPLDSEFTRYWLQLNSAEKESLLNVAKNYVELKEADIPVDIEQYNKEIEDAMRRMDAGEYYTQEQVKESSKHWMLKLF